MSEHCSTPSHCTQSRGGHSHRRNTKAATGDTTKSPGHGGFFLSVTESRRFSRQLKAVTGSKASHFKCNACDPFYFIMILFTLWSQGHAQFWGACGHGVTAKFRRTQIVSLVAALSIAPMGVTTPWERLQQDSRLKDPSVRWLLTTKNFNLFE